ncbi:two-component system histidine kinase [Amycolatopsis mediterranei S699]|uniref:histidine kinase n=2 Tax=Amycolatopsis mediterranei TaxID=33910 RepID=A0A0H3D066_AMYMU|nr:histidine kinase [Amycolatopsis mediterranei]ADJ42906.1 two-component system histidine kinase [Amycolatopsis mediterranei U32]AEK39599.1 two-component system histidine kinase [Amycolatopsis mediterranei S699]AFO74620.1 two-component system histidine kinase [Amycolatopsis mediterranei S699]AGT81749.1 two-component system histidine kinase [Amycolatopsis mediterranei RB]KDO04425.1 histidine kinase [Amycolatopsis mediterranei]
MIDHRRLLARWRRLDPVLRDLPLGLLFLAAAFVPALRNHGTELGGLPNRPFDAPAIGVLLLETLPLAVRRRWPALCLALVSLGFALDQLRGYHSVAGTALAVALVSAGAHVNRRRATTALLFSAAYVLLAVVLFRSGSEPLVEFFTFYLLLVFAWGLGAWLRSTRVAEADRRRRVAEDTLAAERTRIARELHDVVTHHVTAMVVQAEAARYLTAAPDRLDRTLTAITGTGRRAITDLRHLLDLLNPDHGPEARTPSPGGLLALVEHAREAGQPVEFTEEGTPAESAGSADLVAYRVVQEALTNALKHARGSRTSVEVHHGEREIAVAVSTAGSGSTSPGGSGRGLAGLRERVGVLGGDFSAGRDGAGFTVCARIPTGNPA